MLGFGAISVSSLVSRAEIEIRMDHTEVRHYWNGNADAWTKLARAGYDIYRDYLNTPAFFKMLPDGRGILPAYPCAKAREGYCVSQKARLSYGRRGGRPPHQ